MMLEIDVCVASSKRAPMMELLQLCQEIHPAVLMATNEKCKGKL